jgi:hypothetical protein
MRRRHVLAPPWGAATRSNGHCALLYPICPQRGLGGVPPAPLHSARGTAWQRSGRRTGQRGLRRVAPRLTLGCQASIAHEGWAPSNSGHLAALRAVRPAPCSGFSRTTHAASAPCARGRVFVLGSCPPARHCRRAAAAANASSTAPLQRQRSRPPPGTPPKQKPSPARRNKSVAARWAPSV